MTDLTVLPEVDQAAVPAADGPAAEPRGQWLRSKWNENAVEWIAWVRAPGRPDSYWRFHRKHFMSLVPAPGRLTLDIGCGEGRVGRDLQEAGHRVVGVDWSLTMCKAAATYPKTPAHVVVGDAAKLPLPDASADCIVAFMSLQDIDDMYGAITEMARVLEDGKKLALAIVHPMYSGGKFSTADASDGDFVINRSYFKRELCVSHDGQDGREVTFFREHRPLTTYVQTLISAGFSIEQLHEVTEEDQDNRRHQVPMFLDILATRKLREEKAAPAQRPRILRFVLTVSTGILFGVIVTTAIALFGPH